jgi:hypothetical protein
MIKEGAYILREPLEINIYQSEVPPRIDESDGEFRLINGIYQKVIVQGPPRPVNHPMLDHLRKQKDDR